MAFLAPECDHAAYSGLARSLKQDGMLLADAEVLPGDYVYMADGPRVILSVDRKQERTQVSLCDTGGPISGGWVTLAPDVGESTHSRAYRGGSDHVRARADMQESQIRKAQRERGLRHPISIPSAF